MFGKKGYLKEQIEWIEVDDDEVENMFIDVHNFFLNTRYTITYWKIKENLFDPVTLSIHCQDYDSDYPQLYVIKAGDYLVKTIEDGGYISKYSSEEFKQEVFFD